MTKPLHEHRFECGVCIVCGVGSRCDERNRCVFDLFCPFMEDCRKNADSPLPTLDE